MILRYRTSDGRSHEVDFTTPDIIDLMHQNIRSIDLTPLAGLKELKRLSLQGNNISRLDITSLLFCPNLEVFETDAETSFEVLFVPITVALPKALTHSMLKKYRRGRTRTTIVSIQLYWNLSNSLVQGNWNRVLTQIQSIYPYFNEFQKHEFKSVFLEAINLHEYLGVDTDFYNLIEGIPANCGYEKLRKLVKSRAEEILLDQINKDGSTIFINVESLIHDPHLLSLAAAVLDRRKSEITSLEVRIDSNGSVDLGSIWITAYGFKILRSINAGLKVDRKSFDRIKKTLSTLGYSISLKQFPRKVSDTINISPGLREYILFIAEKYRNKHSPV